MDRLAGAALELRFARCARLHLQAGARTERRADRERALLGRYSRLEVDLERRRFACLPVAPVVER